MVLPSRVQYHGTVLGLIAVGVVIVLTLGVFVSTGVGPFIVSGISAQQTGGGQTGAQPFVTGTVTNRGDHAGKARCVVLYTDANGGQIPTSCGRASSGAISTATTTDGSALDRWA